MHAEHCRRVVRKRDLPTGTHRACARGPPSVASCTQKLLTIMVTGNIFACIRLCCCGCTLSILMLGGLVNIVRVTRASRFAGGHDPMMFKPVQT